MFTVTKKPLTPTIVWDEKGDKVLCRFKDGKFLTKDAKLAKLLGKKGYEVEKSDENPEEPIEPDGESEEPIDTDEEEDNNPDGQ